MARKPKSVYERIEEKEQEILEAQELLQRLNGELIVLNEEKDDLEMKLLLAKVKENGLDIETALMKLCENSATKIQNKEKIKKQEM